MCMSTKKSFVLRIDEETFKALEKWAADEFRSVNGQVEFLIERRSRITEEGRKRRTKQTRPNPIVNLNEYETACKLCDHPAICVFNGAGLLQG